MKIQIFLNILHICYATRVYCLLQGPATPLAIHRVYKSSLNCSLCLTYKQTGSHKFSIKSKSYQFNQSSNFSKASPLADLLGLFYIAQTGVVAAYMGATAYMAGKPMGNKVAMSKDMR